MSTSKNKVPLVYSDDLEAVDEELSQAMASLDEANGRVNELLQGFEDPKPTELEAAAGEAPEAASAPEQAAAVAEETPEPVPAGDTPPAE